MIVPNTSHHHHFHHLLSMVAKQTATPLAVNVGHQTIDPACKILDSVPSLSHTLDFSVIEQIVFEARVAEQNVERLCRYGSEVVTRPRQATRLQPGVHRLSHSYLLECNLNTSEHLSENQATPQELTLYVCSSPKGERGSRDAASGLCA